MLIEGTEGIRFWFWFISKIVSIFSEDLRTIWSIRRAWNKGNEEKPVLWILHQVRLQNKIARVFPPREMARVHSSTDLQHYAWFEWWRNVESTTYRWSWPKLAVEQPLYGMQLPIIVQIMALSPPPLQHSRARRRLGPVIQPLAFTVSPRLRFVSSCVYSLWLIK